ncbi:hypothetical protein GGE68_002918 [Rhizobium leguminosarum]|uniref:hypothetical protein n=1 Tax=Rhizobium leguminosarum TaxID=384 RepID=UPI00160D404D|nr:hypothetical protein [Rhizobium leguminosarum]MBB5664721.1 hypothetical protein [Rhizobium leguminosarum]
MVDRYNDRLGYEAATRRAMTARLIILNTCWAALVVWASVQGYTQFVFTHDISGLSYIISALLVSVLVSVFAGHTRVLPHAKVWAVMIGLIGNLVGFLVLASGLSAGDMSSAAGLLKMSMSLIDGLSVAFCSTLVGAVAATWMGTVAYVLRMDASE